MKKWFPIFEQRAKVWSISLRRQSTWQRGNSNQSYFATIPFRAVIRPIRAGQPWTRFSGICETLLVSGVTPVARDVTHLRFAFTQLRSDRGSGVAKAVIRDICKQLDQDKAIWDRQRYIEKPPLCRDDGPIVEFRNFFRRFYAGEQWRQYREPAKAVCGTDRAGVRPPRCDLTQMEVDAPWRRLGSSDDLTPKTRYDARRDRYGSRQPGRWRSCGEAAAAPRGGRADGRRSAAPIVEANRQVAER